MTPVLHFHRARRVLIPLVALLTLAGCRTLPPRTLDAGVAFGWPDRRQHLQALRRFDCAGRVAVAARGEGFNAQFRWQQRDDKAQLALRGPLGSGGIVLDAAGEDVALRLADGGHLDGEQARAELERQVGVTLPVAALGYWLLGAPQPGFAAEESLRAADGGSPAQLESLLQRDWRIDYQPHSGLPRQLSLQGGGARVRLVVERCEAAP